DFANAVCSGAGRGTGRCRWCAEAQDHEGSAEPARRRERDGPAGISASTAREGGMKRAVEEEMTEHEIAQELGISRGRVSQLLKSALRKVRARALLLGLATLVVGVSGAALATPGASLWTERIYHVSCNGSSQ